ELDEGLVAVLEGPKPTPHDLHAVLRHPLKRYVDDGDPKEMTVPASLSNAHTVAKLPAQDLERARAFYRDKLGLEPVEERAGGLRYLCGPTEFHLFSSSGKPSGKSTQMGFEVENLESTIAELRARGLSFERFEM